MSIFGAIGNIVGGFLSRDAQKDANAVAAQNAERNIALQKEFAQSGIQWRVEDAKKAGIHPLYALGASTSSFAPVSVGQVAADGLARSLGPAGQDIDRAIYATQSQSTRMSAVAAAADNLKLENMSLQNQLLASQIARLNQGTGPAMPTTGDNMLIDGQGQAVAPTDQALKRVRSVPGQPESEHAAISDIGYSRTKHGHYPVPSRDVKERIEDNFVHEVAHFVRNNILPAIGARMSPPYPAPAGKTWRFNLIEGYYLAPAGSWISSPGR